MINDKVEYFGYTSESVFSELIFKDFVIDIDLRK